MTKTPRSRCQDLTTETRSKFTCGWQGRQVFSAPLRPCPANAGSAGVLSESPISRDCGIALRPTRLSPFAFLPSTPLLRGSRPPTFAGSRRRARRESSLSQTDRLFSLRFCPPTAGSPLAFYLSLPPPQGPAWAALSGLGGVGGWGDPARCAGLA
jgi:hypothetical protein